MNSSGESVRKTADYLEVANDKLLVICDDIALFFGQMRLKAKGSAGGHNGLKSVEAHLGTLEYPRLRIGVGDRTQGDLAEHVLGKFTEEERAKIPGVVEKGEKTLEIWIKEGIDSAMRFANQIGE
jgi:PTH1 family peptidyl-tRNA hydrolase